MIRIKKKLVRFKDYLIVGADRPRVGIKDARKYFIKARRKLLGLKKYSYKSPKVEHSKDVLPKNIIKYLSEKMGVLQIQCTSSNIQIGVQDIDFKATQAIIAELFPNIDLNTSSSKDKPFNFILANENRSTLHISIEIYDRREEALWVSRNNANISARAIYQDVFTSPGVTKLDDIVGNNTELSRLNNLDVDVVYTWVNHEDKEWKKAFAKANGQNSDIETDAASLTRFHSNDELKYSLRSLFQNANWVRTIYIVSNCQPPTWLDLNNKKIIWINHSEIIPGNHLPTFSSHTIESYLHKISDLSENFIYMNDDIFMMEPLEKSVFFDGIGLRSKSFLEPYAMVSGNIVLGAPDYLNASRNSAQLLQKEVGYLPTRLHLHAPHVLKKSLLLELEIKFSAAFEATREGYFRSPNDVNVTSFLYHHYALAKGAAIESDLRCSLVKNNDLAWSVKLKKCYTNPPSILCINEGGSEDPSALWTHCVTEFLKSKFSAPALWER